MKIAVLGWGSLIWCPRNLRISGEWNKDGPRLPVEFARISQDRRLTLVLLRNSNLVPVLWARIDTDDLTEAKENLKQREQITDNRKIGFVDLISKNENSGIVNTSMIKTWAQVRDMDAVIWTDLPSNFEKNQNKILNETNVILYLRNLNIEKSLLAEKYIRRAPYQIKTPLRAVIEKELGWLAEV